MCADGYHVVIDLRAGDGRIHSCHASHFSRTYAGLINKVREDRISGFLEIHVLALGS